MKPTRVEKIKIIKTQIIRNCYTNGRIRWLKCKHLIKMNPNFGSLFPVNKRMQRYHLQIKIKNQSKQQSPLPKNQPKPKVSHILKIINNHHYPNFSIYLKNGSFLIWKPIYKHMDNRKYTDLRLYRSKNYRQRKEKIGK